MDNKKVRDSILGVIAVVLFAGAAWLAYPSLVTLFQNQNIKSNVAAVIGSGTGTATLTWNVNTETDLASYKIYYGTSPRTGTNPKTCGMCGYTAGITVGKVTTYAFTGMTNGQTYYFSISALDTSNNESAFSGEVSKTIQSAGMVGDINNDHIVNSLDWSIMNSKWFTADAMSDLNHDGLVNSIDFSLLNANWFKTW